MAVTLNLKPGIDLPVYQWLRFTPATAAAGNCVSSDKRGIDRYIYMLLSATAFWRYDTYSDSYQQLANPPSLAFGAGVSMTFDPSQGAEGRIWLFGPVSSSPYAVFAYYDIGTNAWTTRNVPSGLAAAWGTDAHLSHTCSAYHIAGNDDHIYLIGNNATTWYRYSITGNSWSTMTPALLGSAGAGCSMIWEWGRNPDKLWIMRGGGSVIFYEYSISGGTLTTLTVQPTTETFTTGSGIAYDPDDNRIYIGKDATHRFYYFDLETNRIIPAGMWPYTSGTAHVGDGMCWVKTFDGARYLYYRRQAGNEFWRCLVGWF